MIFNYYLESCLNDLCLFPFAIVSAAIPIGSVLLASRFRHQQACHYHRILGRDTTKDLIQIFTSSSCYVQHHRCFQMVFHPCPGFQL